MVVYRLRCVHGKADTTISLHVLLVLPIVFGVYDYTYICLNEVHFSPGHAAMAPGDCSQPTGVCPLLHSPDPSLPP